ncbi:nucleotidyltransferase domain-containing protein [Sphaerisporangium aureirubrum]|uniref:Nucleotidyltransferase domain-containing protein n=1 Tax=Sphaerisporangium aureirubrum TaxID=1544736 RepID=A0ABW1NWB0_9ACTN
MNDHAPATAALLGRFVTAIAPLVPLVSVWVHGSLAGGDYQEGRSDLDLIAVLRLPPTPGQERLLAEVHQELDAAFPLAAKLHCSYAASGELDDPARDHFTWAHQETKYRPITPVTRRELHAFGRVLRGEPPASVLPPIGDAELAAFVVRDLREFWRPALDHPEWWLEDIWVDLGMLTLARATVTLRDGTLVTKRQALAELREMRAPAPVVDDIERRRYNSPAPPAPEWPATRAQLTIAFLVPAIDAVVARHSPPARDTPEAHR